jgi:hypothetical protein
VAVALGLASALVVSCAADSGPGGSRTTDDPAATTTDPTIDGRPSAVAVREAYDRAIEWADTQLDATDPFTLVVYDHLHRRFGIAEFARARPLAVGALDTLGDTNERRLIDPDARIDAAVFDDAEAYAPGLLVVGALACDEPGSPPEFEAWLAAAITTGGYDLTHAAVAIGIETELGCPPTGGDAQRAAIVDALSEAVAADTDVDDVAIERMAMLVYLDALDRIPDHRLRDLVAAQQSDGSFTTTEAGFERHTTALAIWVLGTVVERDEGRSPQAAPLVLSS